MEQLIAWAGFLGAWLLVMGPVFQAALELQEEELDRELLTRTKDAMPKPEQISGWWWLLPPVALMRQRGASASYRRAVISAVPGEVMQQYVRFSDKATGWLLVAGGAFFIAMKETWELRELEDWPAAVFWLLLVVMLFVSLGYTVYRSRLKAKLTRLQDQPGGFTT